MMACSTSLTILIPAIPPLFPSLFVIVVVPRRSLLRLSCIWGRRRPPQMATIYANNVLTFRHRYRCPYDTQRSYFLNTSHTCQVAALRAEMLIANARAAKAEADKDRYHVDLVAAEARADRAQSASVQALRARSAAPEKEESKPVVKEEVKEEDDGEAKLSSLSSPATVSAIPSMRGDPSLWLNIFGSLS
jgi:hypothetical protein